MNQSSALTCRSDNSAAVARNLKVGDARQIMDVAATSWRRLTGRRQRQGLR